MVSSMQIAQDGNKVTRVTIDGVDYVSVFQMNEALNATSKNAYNHGYVTGYDKGYIQGGEDARG